VQQVVALVAFMMAVHLEVMVAAVVVLVDNGTMNTALAVQDLQHQLVAQDHKAVMELVDTQEQVVVQVPHLELLVTLA
jgi:hypothetical protein